MAVIIIIWLTLMLSPPGANLLSRQTLEKHNLSKKVNILTISILFVLVLAFVTGISFTVDIIDVILLSSIYPLVCYFLIIGFKLGKNYIRWVIGIFMFPLFTLGYFLCTIGLFALAMIASGAEVSNQVYFSDDIIVKQTNLGFATSEYRGVELRFYKTYSWLPFIEHELTRKTFNIWSTDPKANALDSYNFKLNYESDKKTIIIYDETHRYEIPIY